MPSSQDAQDPRPDPARRSGTAADLGVAEAEARYHRDRLALYRARVNTGKPTSLPRLRELERAAAQAEDRARRARAR